LEPINPDTAVELSRLEQRLSERFGRIDPGVVHDVVTRRAQPFAASPIQTFVALLTEKAAVAELRARSAPSA
jgi:hypothetical protein